MNLVNIWFDIRNIILLILRYIVINLHNRILNLVRIRAQNSVVCFISRYRCIFAICMYLFCVLCRNGPNVYLPNKKRRPFIFAVSWLFSLEDKLIFSSILLVTKMPYRCKKPADYFFLFVVYFRIIYLSSEVFALVVTPYSRGRI